MFLTERQAWQRLAKMWREAEPDYSGDLETESGDYGLCGCIEFLNLCGLISFDLEQRMMVRVARLRRRPHGGHPDYVWPWTEEGRQARIAYCLKQVKRLTKTKAKARKK